MQNLGLLFLYAITTGAPHGLFNGSIIPHEYQLSICLLMTSLLASNDVYIGRLIGCVPSLVQIQAFVGWFPNCPSNPKAFSCCSSIFPGTFLQFLK